MFFFATIFRLFACLAHLDTCLTAPSYHRSPFPSATLNITPQWPQRSRTRGWNGWVGLSSRSHGWIHRNGWTGLTLLRRLSMRVVSCELWLFVFLYLAAKATPDYRGSTLVRGAMGTGIHLSDGHNREANLGKESLL